MLRSPKEQTAALSQILGQECVTTLIANLSTQMITTPVGGQVAPATLNNKVDAPTCYICCPSVAFINYSIEETRNFTSNPVLKAGLVGLVRAVAPLVRASGLDQQLQLNNWLWSTNPVPKLSLNDALAMRDLAQGHPDRAIVLRSLNTRTDRASIAALRAAGFRLLATRQVYIDDGTANTSNMKYDRKLLRNTPHILVQNHEFGGGDYAACADLYGQLYLSKYTPLNPQYTARFIELTHQAGLIELTGLRAQTGALVAFGGTFCHANVLTQPLVGYDTARPLSEGLYRMTMSQAQSKARALGVVLNISAGVGKFKRLRGARPAVEYTAVYCAHLPRRQRAAVAVMEQLLERVGVPLLRKYEL
ncbi:MAG: GNAT family N-acetyltransferase [Rhodobacteraceae bacterium]|nr:GNAT family N-acetyltransferase [Paracoccaceae bacterium]